MRDSYGLAGNHVLMSCHVPFANFVSVTGWIVQNDLDRYHQRSSWGQRSFGKQLGSNQRSFGQMVILKQTDGFHGSFV